MAMTFSEVTRKYRGTINIATGKPWTLDEILTNSGLSESQLNEVVAFWDAVQKITVARENRMPSIEEIILAHDGPPPVVTVPPKPIIPPRDPTTLPRSSWNPLGSRGIAQLTIAEFEDLMSHILTEHFKQ